MLCYVFTTLFLGSNSSIIKSHYIVMWCLHGNTVIISCTSGVSFVALHFNDFVISRGCLYVLINHTLNCESKLLWSSHETCVHYGKQQHTEPVNVNSLITVNLSYHCEPFTLNLSYHCEPVIVNLSYHC